MRLHHVRHVGDSPGGSDVQEIRQVPYKRFGTAFFEQFLSRRQERPLRQKRRLQRTTADDRDALPGHRRSLLFEIPTADAATFLRWAQTIERLSDEGLEFERLFSPLRKKHRLQLPHFRRQTRSHRSHDHKSFLGQFQRSAQKQGPGSHPGRVRDHRVQAADLPPVAGNTFLQVTWLRVEGQPIGNVLYYWRHSTGPAGYPQLLAGEEKRETVDFREFSIAA